MGDGKTSSLTSRLAVQPSAAIPGIPGFVLSTPEGWMVDQAPGALAVIRLPERVEGFWINAILSHDRVARSVDFKVAARITWQKLLRGSPEATATFERLVRFGDNTVYMRGVEVAAPQTGRALAQLQALFFAPVTEAGKVVDFFQIVCTAPVEVAESYGADFVEIIGSFRFI